MFDNFVNKRIMLVLPVAAALVISGCKENDAAAPMAEPVDLSQTEDLFTAPVKPNPLTTDPETVVVRVNGEDITRGEIMEMMDMAMRQFAGRVAPEQLQQMQGQIYNKIKEDLITQKLITAAITAANIVVDDAKVEETIASIKESIPEGQTLEGALEERGQTLEELRTNIKEDLAAQELIAQQTANLEDVPEAEAKEFYDANPDQFVKPESVTASHILIQFEDSDTDETKAEKKAKLEQIRENVIAGTVTFEDAAHESSDCPSSARGGDLGTFGKGQMVPEFEDAAFSQEIGAVGPIIETQFGYHIVKVAERQEETTVDFEEVKDQLIQYLTNQQKQKAVSEYLAGLRDSATIEEM